MLVNNTDLSIHINLDNKEEETEVEVIDNKEYEDDLPQNEQVSSKENQETCSLSNGHINKTIVKNTRETVWEKQR